MRGGQGLVVRGVAVTAAGCCSRNFAPLHSTPGAVEAVHGAAEPCCDDCTTLCCSCVRQSGASGNYLTTFFSIEQLA
jgi:hypothetical protein